MQNDKSYDSRVEQDIEECRQDVLRAIHQQQSPFETHQSMPSFEDIMKNTPDKEAAPDSVKKEFVSNMVEKISQANRQDLSEEIPSLDLGMQILAQQRKVAGLKRRSPEKESDSQPSNKEKIPFRPARIQSIPAAPPSPQQMIVAEIVAKEIMALSAVR
ncbi:MAG: hypothetical protein PHP01_05890 [Phycisphaerae bacterium]|nr:hypothetical protein [Phycisphaerae bacterium]